MKSDMAKCAVYGAPSVSDAALACVPAEVEGALGHCDRTTGVLVGRLPGMVFVGAPLGSDQYVSKYVAAHLEGLAKRLPKLADLRDQGRLQTARQARTLLLRYCANPQVSFLLRVVPPHLVREAALEYDKAIADCLQAGLFGGSRGDRRWQRAVRQASLPTRMGGLGLTPAHTLCDAAWCGSWALCWAPMLGLFPTLAGVDIASTGVGQLPCLKALQASHTHLLASQKEVAQDLSVIDAAKAAAAAVVPGRGVRVPHALAYHPEGLPKATSLPTLAEMSSATCKLNTRAQRKFTQVVHLSEWIRLATELGGLAGARAPRELSRLVGVSQPLAGAWLQSIPGPNQFRLRSSLYNIMLQRRLGLPCPAGPGRAETLGDAELKGKEHTTRHNRVVRIWVRAVQAVRGSTHTWATHEAPGYSRSAIPDFVSEFAGQALAHELGEIKCYNPVVSDPAQLWRGATHAFGATEARLRVEILGERAGSAEAPLPPRPDGQPRKAKYQEALDGGHTVVPLICEVWGGFAPEAVTYLARLAQARGDGIDQERAGATWSTRSFTSYYGQLLSIAVQLGVAMEIEAALRSAA